MVMWRMACLGWMVLANFWVSGVWAVEGPSSGPPQLPYLRIEASEHTAAIRRLAATADGRLAATVSDDKTIRLWRLPEGEAAGVLRVPIAEGAEGKLYALAMAPDGTSLVVAGHTAPSWDGDVSLYLFDVATGRLRGRLPHQPHFINDLAYSPDGRFVAAVLGGQAGLRVWDSQTFKPVCVDSDYQGRGAWVTYAPDGRLATAAHDGLIRLYGSGPEIGRGFERVAGASAGCQPLAKQLAPAGKLPHSLAFSPNGEQLAVGHYDKGVVDILSGRTLKPLYQTANTEAVNGNLAAVAWDQVGDDLVLWAGGSAYQTDGQRFIRRWSGAGRGAFKDIPVAKTNLNALRSIPGVGLAFVSSDPSWGLLNPDGSVQGSFHRTPLADFRSLYAGRWGVSVDGGVVDFGVAFGGVQPLRFDVAHRSLSPDPAEDGRTQPPQWSHGKEQVSDWQDKPTPRFGKTALKLVEGDISHSAALSADGRRLVMGAEYRLYLFNRGSAQPVRQVSTPSAVWGVAVSGNGRVAVAAMGDGTLGWYSLEPGHELELLGNLFVMPASKVWIAWTPAGFFAHSSDGGQELVGFHFNKGVAETPVFADLSQVYVRLHRPDLVSARLMGARDDAYGKEASQAAEFIATLRQQPLPRSRWLAYCLEPETGRGFERVTPLATPGSSPSAAKPTAITTPPTPDCHAIATATRGFVRLPSQDATLKPNAVTGEAAATHPINTELKRIRLRFEASDEGGGIGFVDLFQNGRLVARMTSRPVTPGETTVPEGKPKWVLERVVELQPGQNDVEIRAYNSLRSFSRSPLLTLINQTPVTREAATTHQKRLFLVAVGINEYPIQRLQYAKADAQAVVQAFQHTASGLFDEVQLIERYDRDANRATLRQLLIQLNEKIQNGDTLILYVAGHGSLDDKGQFFFIPADVNLDNPQDGALAQSILIQALGDIQSKGANILLMLDSCHAGALDVSALGGRIAGQVQNATGMITLAGAAGYEEALDNYRNSGHGLLAYTILGGLGGRSGIKMAVSQGGNVRAEIFGKQMAFMATADAESSGAKKSVDYKKGSDVHFQDFPIARLPYLTP
ncbi:putative Peptidase C14 caspase domain-containing protein [Gammaproteobacteria bacterium]